MAERAEVEEGTVIDMTPTFDIAPLIAKITATETLDELKALATTFPTDLGEPAQADIKSAYGWQKFYLQLIADLEAVTDVEAINTIMGTRFEPQSSNLSDTQIDNINSIYERKVAELTA